MKFINFIRDIRNGELKDKEVLHTLGNIYIRGFDTFWSMAQIDNG